MKQHLIASITTALVLACAAPSPPIAPPSTPNPDASMASVTAGAPSRQADTSIANGGMAETPAVDSALTEQDPTADASLPTVDGGQPESMGGVTQNVDETDAFVESPVDMMPTTPTFEPNLARGQTLYTAYCGFCHGADGEGYTADNANALGNPEFLASASDEFIEAGITYGRPGTPMSAWGEAGGGPLTADDVRHLVAFIRTWDEGEPAELAGPSDGVAIRGEPVYAVYCQGCHGAIGEGVTAMSLNNPRFLDSASDGFIRYAIEVGRSDTAMAAYRDILTPTQIEDVVALIRSWARPVDEAAPRDFSPNLDNAILNPQGSEPTFALREQRFVPADQVKAAMDMGQRMVLLDTRLHGDYVMGHITGATSMPFVELEDFLDQLPQDTWIINYCGCPHAISGRAFDAQREAGFTKIAVLDEGYYVWADRGYPTSVGQDGDAVEVPEDSNNP